MRRKLLLFCISLLLTLDGMIPVYADVSVNPANEYELWTESPYLTSGMTSDQLDIYKAMNLDEFETVRLDRIGGNYYFAACESKMTDGGYSGKSKTSDIYNYLLLVNGNDFIVLSTCGYNNEYGWDCSFLIHDLSGEIWNTWWYTSKGYEVPAYVIEPLGKYTNSNWTEYLDQIVITTSGRMYKFSTVEEDGLQEYPVAYNGLLYRRVDRYKSGSRYYYYTLSDGTQASKLTPYLFQNGNVSYYTDSEMLIKKANVTDVNGYANFYGDFVSNVGKGNSLPVTKPTNYFPDGRYVQVYWQGMGNYLYELWYSIYNSNGTRRANGPTGYSTTFSSTFDTYPLCAIALNDSKFLVGINKIGNSFMKEYYRVAVVQESENGEISSNGGSIGVKGITPPDTTDTVPVQGQIDFAQSNLPLGYNIRDGVIDENKLDFTLRQNITYGSNNILLNDIVIIQKPGYISGIQNTGQTLDNYSNYSYDFGSTYIRLYTNGTNFQWYCYSPEYLTPGEYNKSYVIGSKTVFVKVKVITPPSNSGTTTVTF